MVRISPELWSKYDLLMMRVVPKIHMGRIPPKQSRNLMFNDIRANFRQKAPKPKFDHCIPDPKIDSSLVIEFSLIIIMGSRMPIFDHSRAKPETFYLTVKVWPSIKTRPKMPKFDHCRTKIETSCLTVLGFYTRSMG